MLYTSETPADVTWHVFLFSLMKRPCGRPEPHSLDIEGRNVLALAHFANHPAAGMAPNVMVAAIDLDDASCGLSQQGEQGPASQSALYNGHKATRGHAICSAAAPIVPGKSSSQLFLQCVLTHTSGVPLRRYIPNVNYSELLADAGGEAEGSEDGDGGIGLEADKAVPDNGRIAGLCLVATAHIEDEEVLLNYRFSTHVPRPSWCVAALPCPLDSPQASSSLGGQADPLIRVLH